MTANCIKVICIALYEELFSLQSTVYCGSKKIKRDWNVKLESVGWKKDIKIVLSDKLLNREGRLIKQQQKTLSTCLCYYFIILTMLFQTWWLSMDWSRLTLEQNSPSWSCIWTRTGNLRVMEDAVLLRFVPSDFSRTKIWQKKIVISSTLFYTKS